MNTLTALDKRVEQRETILLMLISSPAYTFQSGDETLNLVMMMMMMAFSPLFILSFSSHPECICPMESRSVSPDKSFHSLERPHLNWHQWRFSCWNIYAFLSFAGKEERPEEGGRVFNGKVISDFVEQYTTVKFSVCGGCRIAHAHRTIRPSNHSNIKPFCTY